MTMPMKEDIVIAKMPARKNDQPRTYNMYLVTAVGKTCVQAYRIIHQRPTNTDAYYQISYDKYVLLTIKFSIAHQDIQALVGFIDTEDFFAIGRKLATMAQLRKQQRKAKRNLRAEKKRAKHEQRVAEVIKHNIRARELSKNYRPLEKNDGKQRQYIRFVQGGSVSPK